MRRRYWTDCKVALIEIQNRLEKSLPGVEAERIEDLKPRSRLELLVIKKRKQAFLGRRVKDQTLSDSPGT